MGTLKNEFKSFLDDIEKNIKNSEDLEYIKKRFSEFSNTMLVELERILELKNEEMAGLEKRQTAIEKKMDKMQSVLDNIENDIYSDDGFDFEIICPYCNYEFIIDVDENRSNVTCPECNNTIELEWNGDIEDDQSNCNGNCHGCSGCNDDDDM